MILSTPTRVTRTVISDDEFVIAHSDNCGGSLSLVVKRNYDDNITPSITYFTVDDIVYTGDYARVRPRCRAYLTIYLILALCADDRMVPIDTPINVGIKFFPEGKRSIVSAIRYTSLLDGCEKIELSAHKFNYEGGACINKIINELIMVEDLGKTIGEIYSTYIAPKEISIIADQ